MSDRGKTLLRGHALRDEGITRYSKTGQLLTYWRWKTDEAHAMCECGALSPANISQAAAKRWHRAHKDTLRQVTA